MPERLHKLMASRGVASRREAERLIAAGAVSVNGRVAGLGEIVDPDRDTIVVRGRALPRAPRRIYIALNKPAGVVTTSRRHRDESIVLDMVPETDRLVPVGRLDRETSGLLLLTNDGAWLNSVAHPRYQVEKEYRATVSGSPSKGALQRLREGVRLPDGTPTAPADVRVLETGEAFSILSITVREGKKRQIRLMCQMVGHRVMELERVRIGSLRLGTLQPGQWRSLTRQEVAELARTGGD